MATLRAASLLLFLIVTEFCSVGETKITAEPGQNVILPCRAAENKPVIVLEWSRTDLGGYEHVALYLDDMFDYEGQHPAYRDRVDHQDKEMKDGDVSLLLKNVTINDSGTYECRVDYRKYKRRKRSLLDSDPICTINLDVSPPGKKQEPKYQEKNNGAIVVKDKNNSGLIVGASAGVSIVVLALFGVVCFLLYKRWKQKQNPPSAEETKLQHINAENHHEAFHQEEFFTQKVLLQVSFT